MRVTLAGILKSFILLTLVGVVIGFTIMAAQSGQETHACVASTHRHRYADLKLALVEVSERDACGFRFTDLERPLSDRVQLSEDFTVAEVTESRTSAGQTVSTALPLSSLRARLRGVISYCEVCRTAFSIKTWREEK